MQFVRAVVVVVGDGNASSLSSLIDDADADPVNEIQTLARAGTDVTLSEGGSVSIADNDNDS